MIVSKWDNLLLFSTNCDQYSLYHRNDMLTSYFHEILASYKIIPGNIVLNTALKMATNTITKKDLIP